MRYLAFALFTLLAATSFAPAAPCQCGPACDCGPLCDCFSASAQMMTYAECQTYCIAHNQPMPVAVGKCEYAGDMVRADWLKDFGYVDGVHWFAPDKGKMYYVGTSKPKLSYVNCANGKCEATYFPTASVGASSCSTGNCGTSAARYGVRSVQGGSCASGNCSAR